MILFDATPPCPQGRCSMFVLKSLGRDGVILMQSVYLLNKLYKTKVSFVDWCLWIKATIDNELSLFCGFVVTLITDRRDSGSFNDLLK